MILVGFALFVFVFGMSVHHRIPDTEHEWNFGALPDTPGESVYSTMPPPTGQPVPKQVRPLPDADEIMPENNAEEEDAAP